MTLRETELIGKSLIKNGFRRASVNHQYYIRSEDGIDVYVEFKLYYSKLWVADFTHNLDSSTSVKFLGHTEVFTAEWLDRECKKVEAIFNFLRL